MDHASASPIPQLWALLDALTLCKPRYGLTPSSLAVLRALISFLPKQAAEPLPALVVWPSNHSLAARADGMDERTLRRHFARLCEAGLIERQSSPNGKRFALRLRKVVVSAFGFNLQPLLDRAAEILAAAEDQRILDETVAHRRTEILALLHALHDLPVQANETLSAEEEGEIRRLLRRTPDINTLNAAKTRLETLHGMAKASHLTASSRQNDRHQQNTENESFESVCPPIDQKQINLPATAPALATTAHSEEDLTLADCMEAVSHSLAFAPEPVRGWTDLIRLADTLAPMIGIERELADHTRRAMGPLPAAISILCLIQRGERIHRPAAYLRKLALLAEQGLYSLKSAVRGARSQRFAGVN